MMSIFLETAGQTNGPNVMPGACLFKQQGCLKIKAAIFTYQH